MDAGDLLTLIVVGVVSGVASGLVVLVIGNLARRRQQRHERREKIRDTAHGLLSELEAANKVLGSKFPASIEDAPLGKLMPTLTFPVYEDNRNQGRIGLLDPQVARRVYASYGELVEINSLLRHIERIASELPPEAYHQYWANFQDEWSELQECKCRFTVSWRDLETALSSICEEAATTTRAK